MSILTVIKSFVLVIVMAMIWANAYENYQRNGAAWDKRHGEFMVNGICFDFNKTFSFLIFLSIYFIEKESVHFESSRPIILLLIVGHLVMLLTDFGLQIFNKKETL